MYRVKNFKNKLSVKFQFKSFAHGVEKLSKLYTNVFIWFLLMDSFYPIHLILFILLKLHKFEMSIT